MTSALSAAPAGDVLRVQRLRETAVVPSRATAGAAGLDLVADLDEPRVLEPGSSALIPTGIAVGLPASHEGQIRPRSGLAAKHGVTVLNAPGTIDEDYRGEIKVLLVNFGARPFTVARGERIAQLVVARVERLPLVEVARLDPTERGDGGFGSTGR